MISSLHPVVVPRAEEGWTQGADGTRLYYSAVGAGEPALVCNDGIGCAGFIWKHLVRDFAPHHRVLRWNYRGHGRSAVPKDRTKVTFDDHCDDLAAVLDAARIPRAVLLGHSMGVQVCLEFHRRRPERVQALVLICGSHGLPLDTFHDSAMLRRLLPTLIESSEKWPQLGGALWRAALSGELAYQIATHLEVDGRVVRRDDFLPYFEHLAGMDPRLFLGMLKHASEHSALNHLEKVDVPTLIVAGTRDTFTPFWLSEEMHDRIEGSELLTVPGGTHVAPIEQPALLALRLEKFLRDRVSRSPSPRQARASERSPA